MKNNNQSQNMHFFCFDPIYPTNPTFAEAAKQAREGVPEEKRVKGNTGWLKPVWYNGKPEESLKMESGVTYNEDGTATLRILEPNAQKVELRYRQHNYKRSKREYNQDPKFYSKDYVIEPMVKGEDGYWELTIDPGVGYHSVYFIVDGKPTLNPWGAYIFDGNALRNFIDIPDDPDTQITDVPHGTISREIYWSDINQRYRCCWVYTPASYQTSNKKYPTVYIQHGGGQDETSWFQGGKIDLILDNLIARGEAEEMIVVANSGMSFKENADGTFFDQGRLDEIIVDECIPFIESRYRVLTDSHSRAVCGLSMGGGHSRRIGFLHPDVFANVGLFSSGEHFPTVTYDCDFTELFSDTEKFNKAYDVVMVACGYADPRFEETLTDVQAWQEKGLNIEFVPYVGQHEWNVWRYCAKDFCKKIFKK